MSLRAALVCLPVTSENVEGEVEEAPNVFIASPPCSFLASAHNEIVGWGIIVQAGMSAVRISERFLEFT
jgi:hypothetical protein